MNMEGQTTGTTNPSWAWAHLLIQRDDVWGPKVLEMMIKWFEENDGKAFDHGRLTIVTDAQEALDMAARMNQE